MSPAFPGVSRQLVVFSIEGQLCGLPLRAVERVLPMLAPSPLPCSLPGVLGVVNLHGRIVPVLDARLRLSFPPRDHGDQGHLVVARTARRIVALPVDEVREVREISAETLTRPEAILPGIGRVAGVVTLEDGLLVIYDLDAFLSVDEQRVLEGALEKATA